MRFAHVGFYEKKTVVNFRRFGMQSGQALEIFPGRSSTIFLPRHSIFLSSLLFLDVVLVDDHPLAAAEDVVDGLLAAEGVVEQQLVQRELAEVVRERRRRALPADPPLPDAEHVILVHLALVPVDLELLVVADVEKLDGVLVAVGELRDGLAAVVHAADRRCN